jgi:shikimate kinase
MKIFLIGFMASGKSSLGQELARHLLIPFFDLDEEVEKTEGKSIISIFEEHGGAQKFRDLEHNELREIAANYPKFVMATGGGTPCYYDHIAFMNQEGSTIFLDVSAGELADRLKDKTESRPLVKGLMNEELKNKISELLEERRPFYSCATYILRNDNACLDDLLNLPFSK